MSALYRGNSHRSRLLQTATFSAQYDPQMCSWAERLLPQLLGHRRLDDRPKFLLGSQPNLSRDALLFGKTESGLKMQQDTCWLAAEKE